MCQPTVPDPTGRQAAAKLNAFWSRTMRLARISPRPPRIVDLDLNPGETSTLARNLLWLVCLLPGTLILSGMSGCSERPELPGGTAGFVSCSGRPLAEVQVNGFRLLASGAFEPVGVGITDASGRFELRQSGSLEAVHLSPGDYRFTIESAGARYLVWPKEYTQPNRTPLRWNGSSGADWVLEIPEPKDGS